ncbi:RNA-directed DNA polymerase, eukaryota, reverse transcriptase zinc-binding domain protein [Tanacetum coccineum]
MGSYRTKEDDVARISTSIYITNFSETLLAKELFQACKQYGHVAPKEHTKTSGKSGESNSYMGVLKGDKRMETEVKNSVPSIVLGDECVMSKKISNAIFGRVKEFASLANLKVALGNEGFMEIVIKYMGELWVMLEFKTEESKLKFKDNIGAMSWLSQIIKASTDFEIEGRIAWVELEGIPFRLWSGNILLILADKWGKLLDVDDQEETCFHSKRICIHMKSGKSINEEFKIIHRGKIYWIRAKETPGWVPDFTNDIDEDDVNSMDIEDYEDLVKSFVEGNQPDKNMDKSEDPFNLYSLLNRNVTKFTKFVEDTGKEQSKKNAKAQLKKELEVFDSIIDCGQGNEEAQYSKYSGGYGRSKPGTPAASLLLDFPKQISHDQRLNLESEVTNVEIKKAVWECGMDKTPGPDGFTFRVFRHFWYLVEECMYTPISLIGSIYKIIAKILTNRLVGVLGGIINEVQSAFIEDRQILDGPFILNEVISWCKRKRKQSLIFKVDFEKAYDSVRWDFLDDVLSKFGFGEKWRKWIHCCLHSSKGSIIINGSPTDEFQFGKGLKQGDPLSPFLFLLIMESLHISFQRVVDAGMFQGIKIGGLVNLSHMFYADDAVFVGEWSESNLSSLVHVLDCFHKVSGLKINMSKSKIMGIEVDSGRVSSAAFKLGCLVFKTPFLYLGSYVGGEMHRFQSWDDIVDRVRRRLSKWKMKMLSIGGRLTLVKSVLGSMPIFHMSMFKVPTGTLRTLESIRGKFFNGHETSSKKVSWVQWNKVLAPKVNGGLGVSSLYALNRGLLFKWVWRFLSHDSTLWTRVIKAIHGDDGNIDGIPRNGANSCWVNIINEIKVLAKKGINLMNFMRMKLGNRVSTLFWDDGWCEGGRLKVRFPRAYALETCKRITVGNKLGHPNLTHSFRRVPRGGVEQSQVEEMTAILHSVSLNHSQDRWTWSLTNSGEYTVASARSLIDSRLLPKGDMKTRWIRYVPIKVNTLAWKVMTNSLPTRFNISRRGIDIDTMSCVNCDLGVETTNHLFFTCDMAKQVSNLIARWWDVPCIDIDSYGNWRTWIDNIRLPAKNKNMLEGVFFVMWWLLWNFRNKKMFEDKAPSKATILDEVICKSFYWCRYRSRSLFSWNDWFKNPSLISL